MMGTPKSACSSVFIGENAHKRRGPALNLRGKCSGEVEDNSGGGGALAGRDAAEGVGAARVQAGGFSVERLMHFVTALEHDVVIEIRPKRKARREGKV